MLKIPPPIWGIVSLIAFYFLSDLPAFQSLPDWSNRLAGVAFLLIGLLPSFLAVAQFRRAGTQVRPDSETNNKLIVGGLYRYTRNPMYLGMAFITLGVALWFGRPLMFLAPALVFVITNWLFIPFEEAKMRRQFGAEFDAYTARVRRWI
ncbi:MAG: isoprenylcysteine carboxylmethyltransferase family protein [Vitreimonas sp.]